MTNRELLARRTTFEVTLGVAIVAGLWAYGWYHATSAVFSDLTYYGINYRDEAYREIVAITERQILVICIPISVVLVGSLIAWGVQVRRDVRAMREQLLLTAGTSQ